MSRRSAMSIDLSRSKMSDNRGSESEEEENEADMFEAARFDAKTTWSEGGKAKDKVLNTIISRFSMLIHREEASDRNLENGSVTEIYSKLPTVLKSLTKLILQLQDHDNRDTREFTIFIATKNWMKTILRPLLEISADDDITTISHCRRLLFFLLRDMTDATKQALNYDPSKNIRNDDMVDVTQLKNRKDNATKQLAALIGFKEALCSERATLAFVKLFNRFWSKEIEIRSNLVGIDKNFAQRPSWEHVGKILFTIGRLLEIDFHPLVSRPDEVAACGRSHMQLIVYFRSVLFALPGIFLQLGEDHKDRYFDQWLSYLFKILHNCLRDFRVKDLHKVLVSGGIIGSLRQAGGTETIHFDVSVTEGEVPVPEAIQKLHAAGTKGLLGEKLREAKANRLTNSGTINRVEGGRHSRFGGVYYTKQDLGTDTKLSDLLIKPDAPKKTQRTTGSKDESGNMNNGQGNERERAEDTVTSNPSNSREEEEDEAPKGAIRPQGIVRRGVKLSQPSQDGLPQAAEKRLKRNSTYALDATAIDAVETSRILSTTGQQACVVVASVVDLICASKGLNEMIKRVGHDFYREDGIFLDEMKLTYFEILSKCLAYNRLKLAQEKKQFDAETRRNAKDGAPAWEPDLRNMSSAMDKLTETHVIASMDDSINRKKYHDVVKAMELYKEIICYIRVQLESSNRFHRDFAVAYMYRLFYASTERTDPLPKLLSEWKPGRYSKRHLHCLVELVHETMKTLDTARNIFGDEREIEKARKSKGRGSAGIELYTSAAYRFDPNEYFKRLVNNQSVRIYTRVLEKYATNEEAINHYVFVFLRRLSNFILEQRLPVPHPRDLKTDEDRLLARTKDPAPNTDGPFSLRYLLFNVTTLSVFSTVLNDRHIERQPQWAPMLTLIKDVTRSFFEAAEKNHLLFVEALFQHPHPIKFWERVDNLYEAQDYKPGVTSRQRDAAYGRYDSDAEEEETARPRESDAGFVVSDDDEGDGEFDENDENVRAVTKADLNRQKAEKRRLKAVEKAARSGKKSKKGEKKLSSSSSSRKASAPWSEAEDERIKDLYDTFKDTSNPFSHIAKDSDMVEFGTERTDKQVEQRCRALGLISDTLNDDGELSTDSDQDATQTQTQPQTETQTPAETDMIITPSQPQATQEQTIESEMLDGSEEDEEESLTITKRSATKKRRPSERDQEEQVLSEPSSPVETSAWESTEVDASRFDVANEAAEKVDSSTSLGHKKRKKTSLKKMVSSQVHSDDEDNLDADEAPVSNSIGNASGHVSKSSRVIVGGDDDF